MSIIHIQQDSPLAYMKISYGQGGSKRAHVLKGFELDKNRSLALVLIKPMWDSWHKVHKKRVKCLANMDFKFFYFPLLLYMFLLSLFVHVFEDPWHILSPLLFLFYLFLSYFLKIMYILGVSTKSNFYFLTKRNFYFLLIKLLVLEFLIQSPINPCPKNVKYL